MKDGKKFWLNGLECIKRHIIFIISIDIFPFFAPWRLIPRVVVTTDDSQDKINTAYLFLLLLS